MSDERTGDAAGYLGWFFLGAIAGAAAAMRSFYFDWRATKKAQDAAEEAQGKAGDLLGKGREYLEVQRSRLVNAFEAGRSAMKEEMGNLHSDG